MRDYWNRDRILKELALAEANRLNATAQLCRPDWFPPGTFAKGSR